MKKIYTISEIQKLATPILNKYGIKKASLFGSYAKQQAKLNSDIDILLKPPVKMGLFSLSALKLELQQILHKPVDIVTYDSVKPQLKGEITATQMTIL